MSEISSSEVQGQLDGVKEGVLAQLRGKMPDQQLSSEASSFEWEAHVDLYFHHFYQAFISSKPALFSKFLSWARSVQQNRDLPGFTFEKVNSTIKRELQNSLDTQKYEELLNFFELGIKQSQQLRSSTESYLDPDNTLGELAIEYLECLLQGDRKRASKLILDEVEQGTEIKDIYMFVFQPCQYEIGRLWQLNKLTVAQEHFCTAATQMIMSQLYPQIFNTSRIGKRVVASTIGGELHEIGIRMVTDFFEMEGWDTYYLGANCPIQDIVSELIDRQAELLALSVTMTQYLDTARGLIHQVKDHDQIAGVKVLVGGRPFGLDHELWKEIGADGYAWDAQQAIETAKKLTDEVPLTNG